MAKTRTLLVTVFLFALMSQVTHAIAPAFATVNRSLTGEWTGTIEGDFRGYDDGAFGDFARQAQFTFSVEEDGTIRGSGTGWERYSTTDGCIQGGADNVEFEISGYVDGDTAVMQIEEVTPDIYPTIDCSGYSDSFTMHPFGSWRSFFEIDLKVGAGVDSGAGARTLSGYPQPGGADLLVIYGGGATAGCPELTITPTLPPASDPRKIAALTDTVSYRMQVAWDGSVPIRVNFDVEGGGATIAPSFTFNPANMQSSPISVLMDVATRNAEKGEYPIAVNAWVIDPETGEECRSNTANLILDAGAGSEDTVFTKRVGPVQVTPDENNESVVIETGDGGAATFTVGGSSADASPTTIDIGSNAAVKEYDKVDYVEKIMADKARTAEALAWTDNDLLDYKEPGAWERLKSSAEEFVKETALGAAAGDFNLYSCLFAPLDANTAEICSEQSVVYVSRGDLHLDHDSSSGDAIDRVNEPDPSNPRVTFERLTRLLMTPSAIIVPNGTELAVSVQQSAGSSATSVTVLEGSAVVIDLVSEEIQLVGAGQKYDTEASFAGSAASATNNLESVSLDSVSRWWESPGENGAPELELDEGFVMTVVVIGVAIFLIIIGAIIIGIYVVVKKIRNRKRKGSARIQQLAKTAPPGAGAAMRHDVAAAAGSKPAESTTRFYNLKPDELFERLPSMLIESGLHVSNMNRAAKSIKCSTRMHGMSWGEKAEIVVAGENDRSVVFVRGGRVLPTNITAKPGDIVAKIIENMDARFPR